ncbi:MAG: hypothetical protein LPK09_07825 [Hymenobacteraceae bacterium]|nr:hypothetical protein [Hymenobacteraceae bacterium]
MGAYKEYLWLKVESLKVENIYQGIFLLSGFSPLYPLLLFPALAQQHYIHYSETQESNQKEDIHPRVVSLHNLPAFYSRENKAGDGKQYSEHSLVRHRIRI